MGGSERERGENGEKLGAERRVQVEGTIGNGGPFLPFSPSRFLSRLTLTGSPRIGECPRGESGRQCLGRPPSGT